MNRTQMLGTLGMLGGASYTLGGVRMLAFGYGQDVATDIFGIVWALGWVAAGWALFALRVTGSSRFARSVSGLLVAGFSAAALWGLHRLIDPVAADRGPFAIAPLLVILGMLGTGILVLRTTRWHGWRRTVPLLIAIVYITTVVSNIATGQVTLPYAFTFAGLGYIVLGDTVRVYAGRADVRFLPLRT